MFTSLLLYFTQDITIRYSKLGLWLWVTGKYCIRRLKLQSRVVYPSRYVDVVGYVIDIRSMPSTCIVACLLLGMRSFPPGSRDPLLVSVGSGHASGRGRGRDW